MPVPPTVISPKCRRYWLEQGWLETAKPLILSVLWGSKQKDNPQNSGMASSGLAAAGTELDLKTGMVPLLEPLNKCQSDRSLLANPVPHHWGWGEQDGGRNNPLPPFTCCLVTC